MSPVSSMRPEEHNPTSAPTVTVNPIVAPPGIGELPRNRMPDGGMDADAAFRLVHDEAMLDGNAQLNLATFVGTWMEPQAEALLALTADKNMIDKDEYPTTAAIENRCVRILADLWHAPDETIGTSTIGSSEACMLAGLAFKRRWQRARKAEGKPADRPNLVMSSAVQVVWEKFVNYWDVEPRYVKISADAPMMTPEGMLEQVDENTIGVVGILGVTFTGDYEPIADLAAALDDLQERTGLDVPLHVDGASGAFVAPFLQKDLVWDFKLDRVHSINASGHKYGLVYPGIGWVLWRKPEYVPEDLIFHVTYLGGDTPTLALNFSRPGSQVLLQYYNFVRLGMEGYTRVHAHSQKIAMYLSSQIAEMAPFELLSTGSDLPVFAWRVKEGYTENWSLYDLSDELRRFGWQVPAYPNADGMEDVTIMRVVVRNGLTGDLAVSLLDDIRKIVSFFDSLDSPIRRPGDVDESKHFAH